MAKPGAIEIPAERDICPAAIRRLVGKFDPAARDALNRNLGRAGEEFVVEELLQGLLAGTYRLKQ
jgi:hypothetical protein